MNTSTNMTQPCPSIQARRMKSRIFSHLNFGEWKTSRSNEDTWTPFIDDWTHICWGSGAGKRYSVRKKRFPSLSSYQSVTSGGVQIEVSKSTEPAKLWFFRIYSSSLSQSFQDHHRHYQVALPLVVYSATFVLGLLGNILILVAVGSQNQVIHHCYCYCYC